MNIRHFSVIDSTNDEARRLAEAGEAGPLWIVADVQTSGHGRRGRPWVSESGNLFVTLLLRVTDSAERCAQLSFAAALAAGDTVAALAPQARVALKWPNDVLLEGRKAAGILLEASATRDGSADWVLIGTGINLSGFPEGVEFPAISVAAVTGAAPKPDAALSLLEHRWTYWFEAWRSGGFEILRQAWLARAAGLGDKVIARTGTREIEGVFQDLDGDGALLLRGAQGSESRVTAGEVFFRIQNG